MTAPRCKNGHEFTPENTRIGAGPAGRLVRNCRTCNNEAARRYKARKREERGAPPVTVGWSPRQDISVRFWRHVQPTGFCWEWIGRKSKKGYGFVEFCGADYNVRWSRVAHRISYGLLVGPIPEGLQLDHLCRNTSCVNPDHLDPVTSGENSRRGRKGMLRPAALHRPREMATAARTHLLGGAA